MTRRILEKLELSAIAAVDRPCQEHAVVTIMKREFSQEERDKLADKGHAMADGSYPIKSKQDLKNAIQAIGRSPHYHAVRRHIISRAKDLGAEGSLPEHWQAKKVLRLADIITKDLIVLPMSTDMGDDDEGAMNFADALEDALECEAWDEAHDKIHPLQHALKCSVISIMLDKSLSGDDRVMMTRNAVEDYLNALQATVPDAYAQLSDAVATKRKRDIKKQVMACRLQLMKLSFMSHLHKAWNEKTARGKKRTHLKLSAESKGPDKNFHRRAANQFHEAAGHFQSGNHAAGRRAFAQATRMAARAHKQ